VSRQSELDAIIPLGFGVVGELSHSLWRQVLTREQAEEIVFLKMGVLGQSNKDLVCCLPQKLLNGRRGGDSGSLRGTVP